MAVDKQTAERWENENGRSAIEKLPGLDEILGSSENATLYAETMRSIAHNAKQMELTRGANKAEPDSRIAGHPPDPDGVIKGEDGLLYRSYEQHRRLAQEGIAEIWRMAEDEGIRKPVEEKLVELRQAK